MDKSTRSFPPPALLDAESKNERLADRIRARIVSGELVSGQALSDKELAVRFNTSRTPVREALLELRAAGLVVAYPQRGTYVFDPDPEDIREICEMRGILEAGAMRLAAARDLDRLVMQLNKSVAHMAFAAESADFARIEAYDTEFHETIVALCGNQRMIEAYQRISDQVRVLRHRLPPRRQRVNDALAQHRRIVDLLTAERVDYAIEEIVTHVQRVHSQLDLPASAGESGEDVQVLPNPRTVIQ